MRDQTQAKNIIIDLLPKEGPASNIFSYDNGEPIPWEELFDFSEFNPTAESVRRSI
jgi:hypothetical protein